MASIAIEDAPPLDLDDVLFEVFSNGQRHAIGTRDDPDDLEPEEPPHRHMMVPLHVLQLLARDPQNRRWEREAMENPGDDEDDDEDEDEQEQEDEWEENDDDEYGSFEEDEMALQHVAMDEDTEQMQHGNDVVMEDVDMDELP